jgi:hypothetical protein
MPTVGNLRSAGETGVKLPWQIAIRVRSTTPQEGGAPFHEQKKPGLPILDCEGKTVHLRRFHAKMGGLDCKRAALHMVAEGIPIQ